MKYQYIDYEPALRVASLFYNYSFIFFFPHPFYFVEKYKNILCYVLWNERNP